MSSRNSSRESARKLAQASRARIGEFVDRAATSAADRMQNAADRMEEARGRREPRQLEQPYVSEEEAARCPKVSIIVPFYNAHATLKRTLEGIRRQTYRNLEIIAVDDGSTDEGPADALAVARLDSRIHIVHKENDGVSSARNVGLDVAKGEWVYFVDADDWITADCIESFVTSAQRFSCDFVISDFYRVAKGLAGHKHGPATGLFATSQFLRYMGRRPADHYYSSLWNKLFKRSLIEEAGLRFDTKIHFGEDHVFILNYLRLVETVALVDKPLYYYIDREGSLVHRGLNPLGVVKMKWDTYRPYLRLFNDVGLYRGLQRPRVYKFIFIPCLDHFVDKGDAPFDETAVFGLLESAEQGGRQAERGAHAEPAGPAAHAEPAGQTVRTDQRVRAEQAQRAGQVARTEPPEGVGQRAPAEQKERAETPGQLEPVERTEPAAQAERAMRGARAGQAEPAERTELEAQAEKAVRAEQEGEVRDASRI